MDNAEATLKVLKKNGQTVQLVPCNKDFKVQTFAAERVKIQGVLKGILRQY